MLGVELSNFRENLATAQMAGILLKKALKLLPAFPQDSELEKISQATQNAFFWVSDGVQIIFAEFAAEFMMTCLDLTGESGISFLAFIHHYLAIICSKNDVNGKYLWVTVGLIYIRLY